MNNTQANPIRYEEQYNANALTRGSGTLALKQLKWDGSEFALIGYLPAGMDITDWHCFARGSLDDCRKAFKSARATMTKWFACEPTDVKSFTGVVSR